MASKKPAKFEVREYTSSKAPAPASPSASIILVAPDNRILLLHRRQTSSAFPSAHVFPGGNLDPSDGSLPSDPRDVNRHIESQPYRVGAIRELFEETGILLAKESKGSTSLLTVSDAARLQGRKAVHKSSIQFQSWLAQQSTSAVLHTEGLIPFTHWITPANVPKRFTTQMYVYFVHLKETGNPSVHPTADEVETMAPEYRTARQWLSAAQTGEIILFPPQFFLLYLISKFLDIDDVNSKSGGDMYGKVSAAEIVARRRTLYEFITTDGSPAWTDKFISPMGEGMASDGRAILHLTNNCPELKGSELRGDESKVVLVKFSKEGPRQLEVRDRKEVLEEARETRAGEKLGKL
jgi:8-oxo-dGTP pyrophosphatase MutT (NUDIX family)